MLTWYSDIEALAQEPEAMEDRTFSGVLGTQGGQIEYDGALFDAEFECIEYNTCKTNTKEVSKPTYITHNWQISIQ